MGMLEDILKALDRFDEWKRMREAPGRVDELQKRIAELETKLSGKWPADVCRKCGERSMRLYHTAGPTDKGLLREEWNCGACDFYDVRLIKPSSR